MDFLRTLQQQLQQIYNGMNRVQRLAVLGAGAVSLGLLALVGTWYFRTDYQVLAAGLAPEEASAIVTKLQGNSVNFKLTAGGTAILVPAEQVQQLRLMLASEDLPGKGGAGLADLTQGGFGESPFTQHVRYLHAQQAELARTIMQIDPVIFARVHITRPESTPFLREQKPTTASVMLKLRPGATLNRNVSAAIIALVAKGVEGLTRENVTLVDAHGRLLSDPVDPETGTTGGSQIEQRRELENYLATRAESMLAQVLGPGRAVVRVTADLSGKRYREKKEIVSPDQRVAISETVKSSKNSSTGSSKGGGVGTSSNLGKPGGTGSSTGSDSREEDIKTDYLVPKTTVEIEDRYGTIERLTIAAMIDLGKPAEGSSDDIPLTLASVQEIIKNAVGFKSDRDEIKVTQVHMLDPNAALNAPDEEWTRQQQFQELLAIVRNASLGVMALAALLLVWALRPRRQPAPEPAAAAGDAPAPTDANPLTAALERDPETLAKILLQWLSEAAPAGRKAA